MENISSLHFSDDTLDILDILDGLEEETMLSKFHNFGCIILYAYMDNDVMWQVTNSNTISTPLELYETPYMAKLLAPKTGNRVLVAFAVNVQKNIFDELDLGLENKIKKANKPADEIEKNMWVIRHIKSYKPDGKKGKPYISYTVQSQCAIKQATPI